MRKIAYVLAGLLLAMVFHHAHAQQTCATFGWTATTSFGETCTTGSCVQNGLCTALGFPGGSSNQYGSCSYGEDTCDSAPPTGLGQACNVAVSYTVTSSGASGTQTAQMISVQLSNGPCPNNCLQQPSTDLAGTSWVPTQSVGLCFNNCTFAIDQAKTTLEFTQIILIPSASPTGASCTPAPATPAAVPGTNCITKSGQTMCVSDLQNYAVINGNIVSPSNAPAPNTCVGYPDGSITCGGTPYTAGTPINTQSTATPPGPDNGTPGQPAIPTATVIGNGTLQNYYSAATCQASSVGCATKGTTSGTASGQSQGNSTSGVPGDCNQSATDASGCHGTLPSLVRNDTIASNTASMLAALQTTPLIAAMVAAGTFTLPVGTCPTATFTIFGNHTFDMLSSACTIFNMQLNNLIAISDAVWGLLGVFIILSA